MVLAHGGCFVSGRKDSGHLVSSGTVAGPGHVSVGTGWRAVSLYQLTCLGEWGRVCRGKLCSACNGDNLVPAPLRQSIERPKEAVPPARSPMSQGEEKACQFLGRGRRVQTGVNSAPQWNSCGLSGQWEHECPRSRVTQRRHSSQGTSATKLVRAEYKDTSETALALP